MQRMRRKGTGTIVKIGALYYPRWTVENGERVYGSGHKDRDAAEIERIKKRPAAKPQKKGIPTVEEWSFLQLDGHYGQKEIEASTLDTNETIRLKHIEGSHLGSKPINRVTKSDCQTWVYSLSGKAHWVRRCAALMSKLFSLAIEQGLIHANPMRGVKLPKVEERENTVLSSEQAVKLMNPKTRIESMILVALVTGIRRGELCRLEWKHVHADHLAIPVTKPRKMTRIVPLIPEAKAAIDAQPKRCEFVFSTETGRAIDAHNLTRDFKAAKEGLGIPAATRLQDMRGSFISMLFGAGVDPRTVMELAGHGSIKTTMQSYARSNTPAKQAAVEKLRNAMGLVSEVSPKKKRVKKSQL